MDEQKPVGQNVGSNSLLGMTTGAGNTVSDVKWPKAMLIDKDGWPVCFIDGRPVTNVIRALLLTDINNTFQAWRSRKRIEPLVGLSPTQCELRQKHGTPAEFATACYRAVPGFISMDEAATAIRNYNAEWHAARPSTPDDYRAELHTADCSDEQCPGCLTPNA